MHKVPTFTWRGLQNQPGPIHRHNLLQQKHLIQKLKSIKYCNKDKKHSKQELLQRMQNKNKFEKYILYQAFFSSQLS